MIPGVRAKDLRTEDGPYRLAAKAVVTGAVDPVAVEIYSDDKLRDRMADRGVTE